MGVVISSVLPVLLTVLVGYYIARTGKPFDRKTITYLVGMIGTPVLIFNSLTHTDVAPQALARMGGATLVAVTCFLLIGYVALRASRLPATVYLPSLSFPNTGNLGLPLSYYAFGSDGLDYAIAVFALVAISNHTIGQTISAGRGKWRAVASNPVIPAVVLGIIFGYNQIDLPTWLDNLLEILSGVTIPLMLLMLGTSLATIPVTTFTRSAWLSVIRLGMGMAVGFGVASLFGFTGAARGALVLQCAMPVAVYNYVYAQMYEKDPEGVASLIVVSTVFSVVTIPVLLAVLAD